MSIIKRIKSSLVLWIVVMLFFSGCENNIAINSNNTQDSKKEVVLDIMTSNKFIYSMIGDIAKDKHILDYMFKSEKDIFDFEVSEDSIANVGKKDLFMYSGLEYEPWISELTGKVESKSVGIINLSKGARVIPYTKEIKYNNKTFKDNPYYWLNIDNYKVMMLNIKNSIEERDPKNRQFYEDNFAQALKEVDKEEKKFKDLQLDLNKCLFVAPDDKLDYFAKYNGLKVFKIDDKTAADLAAGREKGDLDKKLGETKKVIMLYASEMDLISYDAFVKKYNIKLCNIVTYKNDYSYKEIVSENYESLKKAME